MAQVRRRVVGGDSDGAFGELQRPFMVIKMLGDHARQQQARRECGVGSIQFPAACIGFAPVARLHLVHDVTIERIAIAGHSADLIAARWAAKAGVAISPRQRAKRLTA